ncbi:MAG: Hpt domain-containing protein [Saprospiraceae bacterium]|nr:Hpt domain-containing protein [Saprospiraceae bacterium]MCF8252292.1 Hpt domain-containing protein [Saprospiraceae bacterium]MCF8282089.1 Hpt domain-containing protein [Bacteroidales bacterium]MCF8313933.1 Hpt domain-containing protein [Saprospiraceae bacterium]MCF8442644.1 Hpt domain-containing protein [Saprospiraceae bacterium]
MEITTETCINLDYLRLMSDNDGDMIQTMLAMLLEELPEEMGKIRELCQAENWDELTRVSHKMKSTLAFVGNDAMTSANKELERVTKYKTDIQLAPILVATLNDHLPQVMKALQNEVKEA